MCEFIRVMEDIEGLPAGGNRDCRVTRASLKLSWSTGWEEPAEFAKQMGENSLSSYNKELTRNFDLCVVLCSRAHTSPSLSRWL